MTDTLQMKVAGGDITDDERWQAVQARDNRFDGGFVYAVRSTGIYCRPSCPSRRPKRGQVLFFVSPDIAELAGFRPCQRCQPRVSITAQSELVERVRRWIEEHGDESVKLAVLGMEFGVSPYHLQRTFKRFTGVTPRQYATSWRLARLKGLLREGKDVTSAMYEAGYGSSSRLYEQAPASIGMTPNTYRRGGQGVEVSYAIVDCPLGRLLVAATERGICAIGLSDSDAALEAFLKSELPAASIRRDDADVRQWIHPLLEHLDGRHPRLNVPIDIEGTDFQLRVWEALRMIPYGGTRSYADIAHSLGQPSAARAVAQACAANPVAIVIPCHRVIRKDGGLGGYRWGLERKQALLKREGLGGGLDEHG